jgi:hypothetical protein
VHFVDHDQPDARRGESVDEAAAPEALGSGVQQLDAPRREGGQPPLRLVGLERRVHEGGLLGDGARELVQLVLHQGDERGDDERGGGTEDRGELVRERLARAGRHQREGVSARERALDDVLLAGEEAVEAERTPKRVSGTHGRRVSQPDRTATVPGPCRFRLER